MENRHARIRFDKVARGINMGMKTFVSALWAVGGAGCFWAGAWPLGLIAMVYLAYLWVLGGRWLIF